MVSPTPGAVWKISRVSEERSRPAVAPPPPGPRRAPPWRWRPPANGRLTTATDKPSTGLPSRGRGADSEGQRHGRAGKPPVLLLHLGDGPRHPGQPHDHVVAEDDTSVRRITTTAGPPTDLHGLGPSGDELSPRAPRDPPDDPESHRRLLPIPRLATSPASLRSPSLKPARGMILALGRARLPPLTPRPRSAMVEGAHGARRPVRRCPREADRP